MALTVEGAGKVRQKVRANALSPGIFYALKALFLHLATNKGNPDLKFCPIDGLLADDATGTVLVDAACTLYAVYAKKTSATGRTAGTTTDAYLVIFDDAVDDAGAGTDGRVVLPFLSTSDEAFYMNPDGLSLPTGCVAKSYTDFDGTTDSTAADAPYGFAIVGV